jgi:cell division septal protein FtsQ
MRLRPFLRKLRNDLSGWGRVLVTAVVAVVLVAGAGYGSYARAWPSVVAHPYFRLKSVRVTCDTDTASAESLASRAGLYEGTSLWDVDAEEVSHRLEEADWVQSANVSKRFPDRVSVDVKRRVAVAATLSSAGPFLIDASGVVYREEGALRYPDLPYVTGWNELGSRSAQVTMLHTALEILKSLKAEGIHVSQLHVDRDRNFWLYPDSRASAVRLGDGRDYERQARTLRMTLERLPEAPGVVREIDLSFPDRAILRTAKGGRDRVLALLASREAETRARGLNDRG